VDKQMGTFGPGEDRIGYVVSVGVKQDEVVDLLRGRGLSGSYFW